MSLAARVRIPEPDGVVPAEASRVGILGSGTFATASAFPAPSVVALPVTVRAGTVAVAAAEVGEAVAGGAEEVLPPPEVAFGVFDAVGLLQFPPLAVAAAMVTRRPGDLLAAAPRCYSLVTVTIDRLVRVQGMR